MPQKVRTGCGKDAVEKFIQIDELRRHGVDFRLVRDQNFKIAVSAGRFGLSEQIDDGYFIAVSSRRQRHIGKVVFYRFFIDSAPVAVIVFFFEFELVA